MATAVGSVTLNPVYIPFLQKPSCCAVTCLQMILYRNGVRLYDQEELAQRFGVKIGSEEQDAFRSGMPVRERLNYDEGISTMESVDALNKFFAEESIGMKATRYMYSQIESLQELLIENLRNNNEIWIEYHSQEIHDSEHIHDGLVESVDLTAQTVVIIDPVPRRRQRITVPIAMLERALSATFGKELGVISVKKVDL
ncbi:MAG: hypothetical protein JWM46_581 [Candidatus Kaiserbacteria bacterium]|nr:hypothetical protein [Candidatus Kaiserbacteria bacterium]